MTERVTRLIMVPDTSGWPDDDLRWAAGYHKGLRQDCPDAEAADISEWLTGQGWTVTTEPAKVDVQVKSTAWIVDIDGTLALRGERGPFDWARVGEDTPNAPVVAVVRALSHALIGAGGALIYVSGRMEQCREATDEWLRQHVIAQTHPHHELYLRADDDYRPDEIVKQEIYEKEIRDWYEIVGVLDDRAKVVRMWRSLGLTVLQCADGDF